MKIAAILALIAVPAIAQQSGTLTGKWPENSQMMLTVAQPQNIYFMTGGKDGKPALELRADGSIWVHGREAANDKEVVEAARAFFRGECAPRVIVGK